MDHSAALNSAFEESGLSSVLKIDWCEHKPKESRTKLQFVLEGARRVRSLELVGSGDDVYPRVHFLKDVDPRIKEGMLRVPDVPIRKWGGKATSTDHGISYEAGPQNALLIARHLRHVLSTLSDAAPDAAAGVVSNVAPNAASEPVGPLLAPVDVVPCASGEILRLLRSLDEDILRFAASPANRDALLRRTRSYSTPFRGTLFGEAMQEAVAQQLARRPASVLVLGANPNDSGEQSPAHRLRSRSLEEQVKTGFFAEAVWNDHGVPQPEWNASALRRWEMVFNPLGVAGVAQEEVAFANFVPWGSSNLEALADSLGPLLLARVVGLAESLLVTMVRVLRPRLLVVPESVSKQLATCSLARQRLQCAKQSFRYPTAGAEVATFDCYAGVTEVGGHQLRVVHLRHPSSLRLSPEGRRSVETALGDIFRTLLRA